MILPADVLAFNDTGLCLGLLVMVLYGIYGLWGSDEHATLTRGLVLSLWLLHGLAVLGSLWLVSEDAPRFGFAPALSASAWLIFSCYVLERHWFPQFHVRRWVALMGLLSVGLALFFPGQALHWNASPWLPLHWVLGIASYGLLGAGVVHALVLSNAERRIRLALPVHEGLPLLTMERLTYRFVKAGFVLLSATLLVGGLFGDALYGAAHAFRWDHKTVFSVLSWVTLAVLLWGRWRWGWRGHKAARVLYLGAGFLFLAYAGSRFVLEVILHRPF
jgi:ABC-type uncharacterized transport system permease subunit